MQRLKAGCSFGLELPLISIHLMSQHFMHFQLKTFVQRYEIFAIFLFIFNSLFLFIGKFHLFLKLEHFD